MVMNILGQPFEPLGDSPGGASARGTSRLSIVHECEAKWGLRYGYGFRAGQGLRTRSAPDDQNAVVGALVHLHLAYYYAEQMRSPPPWFFDQPFADARDELGRGQPAAISVARECADAYQRHYVGEVTDSVGIELELAVRLGDLDPGGPYPELDDEVVTGRFDRLYEHQGALHIDDFKTRASKGQRLYKFDSDRYRVNRQVLLYLRIARLAFPTKRVGGFVVREVKQYPPFDFARHSIVVDPEAYEAAPRLFRLAVKREFELAAKLQRGEKLSRSGVLLEACNAYNRRCEFYGLCWAGSDADRKHALENDYARRQPAAWLERG